jgi:DNA helicase IV
MPRLKMPGVEDLTEEQDKILRLPDEGRYFVGGPPGTGKTVLALLRAHAMTARRNRPMLLMHNLLLRDYCRQWLVSRGLAVRTETWQRWFTYNYHRTYGVAPPQCPANANGWRPYDWRQIEASVAARPVEKASTPVLIDEGQDLPRHFYQYLSLHFTNVIVFADENQTIDEHDNSTKENIWAELAIPPDNRHLLKTNHRNTLEVARVARHFYAGTDAGIPELPKKNGPTPYLVEYGVQAYMAERVVRQARLRPHHLIAVMTANNENWGGMRETMERLCAPPPGINFMFYQSGHPPAVDFSRSGIVLLNMQSAKGLEFDSVLIPDLHAHFVLQNSQAHKMRLYVATSRATERLFLMRDRNQPCPILPLMPAEEILKRYNLPDQGGAP